MMASNGSTGNRSRIKYPRRYLLQWQGCNIRNCNIISIKDGKI